MSDSPAAVIVDGVHGLEIAVADGVEIPALTRALLVAGLEGTTTRTLRLSSSGSVVIEIAGPSSAAVAAVPQSVTTVTLMASNAARKGGMIFNNANQPLFMKFGGGATTSDFSVRLPAGATVELPFPAYTGPITGVWSVAGSGTAQVSELT